MKEELYSRKSNLGALSWFLQKEVNSEYLKYLEENIPTECKDLPMGEKVWYYFNEEKTPQLCICGKHRSFISFKNGYRPSCGAKECYSQIRKETCIEKYGVDNPKKTKEVNDKAKENILKKYNGVHYTKTQAYKEKHKKTMMERYGVEHALQSPELQQKAFDTWENNPNRETINKQRAARFREVFQKNSEEILTKRTNTKIEKYGSLEEYNSHINQKTMETSLERYGVDHFNKCPIITKKRNKTYSNTILEKVRESLPDGYNLLFTAYKDEDITKIVYTINCPDCTLNFEINRQLAVTRMANNHTLCMNCNPVLAGSSMMERELLKFISENYNGVILDKDTKVLNGKELDIYLPELNIAFEMNGLYWHSDAHKEDLYHLHKTVKCWENDITLYHVWEDDWLNKKEIVKSMVLNKIGQNPSKIAARKTIIKVPSNSEVRTFLEENHIQGFVGSNIKLGLYYNEELVSLMTFGGLRKVLGQKAKEGSFELLRFCNKLNHSVVGGASKLLSHFVKNYEVDTIVSYSDVSRSVGNMYQKLGFTLEHSSSPNYYYVINNMRENRFKYRKNKLVELGFDPEKSERQIMLERGINRIYDCGTQKWILTINQE